MGGNGNKRYFKSRISRRQLVECFLVGFRGIELRIIRNFSCDSLAHMCVCVIFMCCHIHLHYFPFRNRKRKDKCADELGESVC